MYTHHPHYISGSKLHGPLTVIQKGKGQYPFLNKRFITYTNKLSVLTSHLPAYIELNDNIHSHHLTKHTSLFFMCFQKNNSHTLLTKNIMTAVVEIIVDI